VELSEKRLVVYGETGEKVDFRHVWLSRFTNAKMIGVYFFVSPFKSFDTDF
jgi:hypothetical protein